MRGYALVSAFLVAKLMECLSQRHWFFRVQQIGVRIRAVLVAMIYNKGLTLSCQSKQCHTSGEIINFMTVDVERIGDFTWLGEPFLPHSQPRCLSLPTSRSLSLLLPSATTGNPISVHHLLSPPLPLNPAPKTDQTGASPFDMHCPQPLYTTTTAATPLLLHYLQFSAISSPFRHHSSTQQATRSKTQKSRHPPKPENDVRASLEPVALPAYVLLSPARIELNHLRSWNQHLSFDHNPMAPTSDSDQNHHTRRCWRVS
ncbi:putative xenobiotic-transporting ATPase [Rosa chinensis]|uniref:Putative xenobiotic-transporting ATPase n=1 Tax=Rosa chinensis TaxID=74649 RepID=A0A2P6QBS3_ROSCH|nr:putative xenobiotic-transporting ATPase [Rosa chinensis]